MPLRKKEVDPHRDLMIRVKAFERMAKEVAFYKVDLEKQEAKLADMKSAAAGAYDEEKMAVIKRFAETVVADAHSVLPDSTMRLNKALTDLEAALVRIKEGGATTENNEEWKNKAELILKNHGRKQTSLSPSPEDAVPVSVTDVSGLAEGEAF